MQATQGTVVRSTTGRQIQIRALCWQWLAALVAALVALPAGQPTAATALASGEDQRILLLLSRATYGARPGDLAAARAFTSAVWLERQLNPALLDDSVLAAKLTRFAELELSMPEMLEQHPRPDREARQTLAKLREMRDSTGELGDLSDDERQTLRRSLAARRQSGGRGPILQQLTEAKLLRAVESERQLQEVMVDFWLNHFNVYGRKSRETALALPSFERDVIRRHAFGKFEDLLVATAKHPAMLLYLDNWLNTKDGFDPRAARRADRLSGRGRGGRGGRGALQSTPTNRAAEPGKQRTFGINENYARELLELHTLGVDGGYSQADVVGVARALSGWTTIDPARSRRQRGAAEAEPGGRMDGEFHFIGAMHDDGPKQVLGRRIAAGGIDDGHAVLALLAQHPATARFISTKLAKRFVSDAPSEPLIEEMSAVFLRTGGDLRAVLRAMFASDRFVQEGLAASKLKTPLELVVSAIRASEARFIHAEQLGRRLGELGMPLYLCQPPTGYDEEAETWLGGGSTLARLRFVGAMTRGEIDGLWLPLPPADVDEWARRVAFGVPGLGSGDVSTLREALGEFPAGAYRETAAAMALVLASPAFQRQ